MDFTARYNRKNIVQFLKNNFLPQDFETNEKDVYIPDNLRLIHNVTELGKSNKLNLTVYEVQHDSKDARISLTKEIFSLMKMQYTPNALVFFVTEKTSNYRMSLVYFDYETENEYFKLSNPKRYSFYLGEGVPTHTPEQYLVEKGRVVDEKDLKERFSVEVLSKDFYKELSDWYAWATSDNNVHFPESELDIEQNKRQQVIRLIIRLLFVWFLKQKDLIPEELFDEGFIGKELLKDFAPRAKASYDLFGGVIVKSTYYKAILQNLFFATLNCPIRNEACEFQRGFRTPGQHRDVNFLMRYEDMFKSPETFVSMMNSKVPFLNGGLFDCLDDKSTVPPVYVDCFTDSDDQSKLVFPDYLFFGEDEADLTGFYAKNERGKTTVRGIINILKTYNFTVEENTPVDIEVSLDPELLGKVFENLLADYNPETRESARKSTGSFYTPREIVQFMVDESITAYLSDKVKSLDKNKIRALLSYSDNLNEYSTEERKHILSSIYECKILDPACGSGAFPMGILQQMVHVMNQLDPDNTFWQEIMLENLAEEEALARTEDDGSDLYEIKERRDDISKTFDENLNRPDYARKLYLIENCIHGIDVQPIAVQISKLRFFISLVVEQHKTNNAFDNFGIRPLPNLEAKIVAADSLIKIKRDDATLFASQTIKDMQLLQKDYCHRLFRAKTTRTKAKYRKAIKDIRHEIALELADNRIIGNSDAALVGSWDMFDQNTSAKFFDPEWMFGINDGFDIIIGNPPYIMLSKDNGRLSSKYCNYDYETFSKSSNIYCLFYERGFELLKENGTLCYITSNKWLRAGYGEKVRKYFVDNADARFLLDFGGIKVFSSATVDTNILLVSNEDNKHHLAGVTLNELKDLGNYNTIQKNSHLYDFKDGENWIILSEIDYGIRDKIISKGKQLKDWDIKINYGLKTGCDKALIIDDKEKDRIFKESKTNIELDMLKKFIHPVLKGKNIKNKSYTWDNKWIINIPMGFTNSKISSDQDAEYWFSLNMPSLYSHFQRYLSSEKKTKGKGLKNRTDMGDYWWELRACAYLDNFSKPKVIYPETTQEASFAYDESGIYIDKTCFMMIAPDAKYLQATLTSKLFKYAFKNYFSSVIIGSEGFQYNKVSIMKLPVIPDVKDFEDSDDFFYDLYGLTEAEKQYIEKNTSIDV